MFRRLPLTLLLVVALVIVGTGTGIAWAKPATVAPRVSFTSPLTPGSSYLALGDSVTFGYQEPSTVPAPDYANAASFLGYPEQVARQVHVRVTNLACPGETSGSLINVASPSNGCEDAYRKASPLHVRYSGSQLSYAVSYLRRHPRVRLVSLMIGANDLFRCQANTADGCANPAEQQQVLNQISANVRHILIAIRRTARYSGQVAILNYYSLNYASAIVNHQSQELNQAQDSAARPFHVVYANGYGAFEAASVKYANQPCLAGLVTQLASTVGKCGVHPTYAGQALLAAAVLKAIRL